MFVKSASIDTPTSAFTMNAPPNICAATIRALNDRPLKVLRGLKEFYRVLKKRGELVISDEYPLPKATRTEEE